MHPEISRSLATENFLDLRAAANGRPRVQHRLARRGVRGWVGGRLVVWGEALRRDCRAPEPVPSPRPARAGCR